MKKWTRRELKGLVKLSKTRSCESVAKHYGVSYSTVKNIAHLFGKSGVKVIFAPQKANVSALIRDVAKDLK